MISAFCLLAVPDGNRVSIISTNERMREAKSGEFLALEFLELPHFLLFSHISGCFSALFSSHPKSSTFGKPSSLFFFSRFLLVLLMALTSAFSSQR